MGSNENEAEGERPAAVLGEARVVDWGVVAKSKLRSSSPSRSRASSWAWPEGYESLETERGGDGREVG